MCITAQRSCISFHFRGLSTSLITKFSVGEMKFTCIYLQPNVTGFSKCGTEEIKVDLSTRCSWKHLTSGIEKNNSMTFKRNQWHTKTDAQHNTSWNELQIDDEIEKREVNVEKILQLLFKGSREWNGQRTRTASHPHGSSYVLGRSGATPIAESWISLMRSLLEYHESFQ